MTSPNHSFITMWGKVKQVLGQVSIYFSCVSIISVIATAWHTTVSPILESYGISLSFWWPIGILGFPLVILILLEWHKGTDGYFRSFARFFYTKDGEMKKDIDALMSEIRELRKEVKELKKHETI